MSQLSLNAQVFGGLVLFHWPACPSIPTCGTSLLTTALALDGGGGDTWPHLFKGFYQRTLRGMSSSTEL